MNYGQLPKQLGKFIVDCKEMMFYQYLPIKLIGEIQPIYEERLKYFDKIVGASCCDYIADFGLDNYRESYVYLTAKYMYQDEYSSYNRHGWHSDGFMTNDINYIWCDKSPTLFNTTNFALVDDDKRSLIQMKIQAKSINNVKFEENELLRLNQYVIHKVAEDGYKGMRCFVKISFSKDKYDLIGNSRNYLLNYEWEMKERKEERNIPQTKISTQPYTTI